MVSLQDSNSNSNNSFQLHSLFSSSTNFSAQLPEDDIQPTVNQCIHSLASPCIPIQRTAAYTLRLLAKTRPQYRSQITHTPGAISFLLPLLNSLDPSTQEHAVTAILNLSLHPTTKFPILNTPGSIDSIIYVLNNGTHTSKQNAAAALMSLSMFGTRAALTIGASGAIPPLVALLIKGTTRGKKDSLTTLYKLCSSSSLHENKERAVRAGVVGPLVGLVGESGSGMEEKAMVVLICLGEIEMGRDAIGEHGGISALLEIIEQDDEDGSNRKRNEYAVATLVQLCGGSVKNRALLVAEGGIPPLVALSQAGTPRAKHKAQTLLAYLRELRHLQNSPSTC